MPRRRRGAAQAVLSRAANARRGRSHDASVPSNRHQDNGLSSSMWLESPGIEIQDMK